MLYSLKKEAGHERPKDKSTNKNKLRDNTHPLSPHPNPDIILSLKSCFYGQST